MIGFHVFPSLRGCDLNALTLGDLSKTRISCMVLTDIIRGSHWPEKERKEASPGKN